jgi:hypothetical protein
VATFLAWVAVGVVTWPAFQEHWEWFSSLLIFLLVAAFAPKTVQLVAKGRWE